MRVLIRLLLVVLGLLWLVFPGFGLADLSVTWDEDWQVILEAGWGLASTIGLALPSLLVAARPRLARAACLQLYVVTIALAVGAIVGREPQAWWFFVLLGVELALVRALDLGATPTLGRSRALLVLAAISAPGWLAYASWSLEQNRQSRLDADISVGVDHYAVQGAVAVALVALPAVAGLAGSGRRLLGTSTAIIAGYLGLLSLSWPDQVAGFAGGWSIAAMLWAVTVLVATWWPTRAIESEPTSAHHVEQPA